MLGEVLERKQTRNSIAISRYSGAIFRNSGAIPKSVHPPRNLCVCMCLHLPFLAHLFAMKARANICVSMGPGGRHLSSAYAPTLRVVEHPRPLNAERRAVSAQRTGVGVGSHGFEVSFLGSQLGALSPTFFGEIRFPY